MTLYYSLCFLLLALELFLSFVILAPFPHAMRRNILRFLNENPYVAKVQYGLKISFIFIALLFVDATQRLIRIAQEKVQSEAGGVPNVQSETAYHSRKFYAQRNIYLTGGTLILALVLARAFSICLELAETHQELGQLKKGVSGGNRTRLEVEQLEARIGELEGELEVKERDIATIKKQASAQAAEFDRQGAASVGATSAGIKKSN